MGLLTAGVENSAESSAKGKEHCAIAAASIAAVFITAIPITIPIQTTSTEQNRLSAASF